MSQNESIMLFSCLSFRIKSTLGYKNHFGHNFSDNLRDNLVDKFVDNFWDNFRNNHISGVHVLLVSLFWYTNCPVNFSFFWYTKKKLVDQKKFGWPKKNLVDQKNIWYTKRKFGRPKNEKFTGQLVYKRDWPKVHGRRYC